jgi:1-phosphofructokinase
MLAVLEIRTLLCAPLGGEIGAVLEKVLRRDSLEIRSVPTGSNGCFVEDRRPGDLTCLAEMPGTALNRHESDELCNQVLSAGMETGVVVLTGPAGSRVVDPDVYRRVAADLQQLGVTVVADLSGDELDAAIEGGVDVLKISDEETPGRDAVTDARKLRERVDDAVVLTRGSAPALLLSDDVYALHVPKLAMVNHRGAGDSMTAGIAAALARGQGVEEAVRLGAAAGAVNVTRHGLASGRRDTIEHLADHIRIEKATEEEMSRAGTHHE